MAKFLVYILLSAVPFQLIGQINLHPSNKKEERVLKHRVLNNTDHFYFGLETGVVFMLGEPTAITPGAESNVSSANQSRMSFRGDYSFIETSKIYVGYAFKAHHFELANGGIVGKMYVYDANNLKTWSHPTMHGTLMFRYYYRIPIKSNFVKLLLGPELGWAYRMNSIFEIGSNNTTEVRALIEHSPANHNIIGGINTRLDFKLAKNLTFNFQVNYCAAFPNKSEFRLYENPYDLNSPFTAYNNSIMNLNLSFGLKFDFFIKKKKQQTFDQLGIQEPYLN